MKRNEQQKLRLPPKVWSALEYAICVSNCWISDGRVQIDLLEKDVFALQEKFLPVYERRGGRAEEKLLGFDVRAEDCSTIREQFRDTPRLAKIIAENLAINVLYGYPVPEGLRTIAYYILSGSGTITRPKAVKPSLTHRDTLLVALAKRVKQDADIPLGIGEVKPLSGEFKPICGATIVAAAFHAFGVHINVAQAAKIVYEKGKLVENDRISDRILNMNFGAPEFNALAAIPTAVALRKVDMSALQNEFESAVRWLETPL
jgi:hypothetical protein